MRMPCGRLLLIGLLLSGIAMASDLQNGASFVEFDGTVVRLPFEGGFCGLLADDGHRYEPTNLPVRFCKPDLRVRVKGVLQGSTAGFRMWGEPIEIIEISAASGHGRP